MELCHDIVSQNMLVIRYDLFLRGLRLNGGGGDFFLRTSLRVYAREFDDRA